MWTGPVWLLAQLLDEHDALLQLRLALLELLHLLDDRVQPRGFLLRGRDLRVELRSTRCPSAQYRQPMNSAGDDQDRGCSRP